MQQVFNTSKLVIRRQNLSIFLIFMWISHISPFTDFTSSFFIWVILKEWKSLAWNLISSLFLGLIFSFLFLPISFFFLKCNFYRAFLLISYTLSCNQIQSFNLDFSQKQMTLVFYIIQFLLVLLVIFLLWKVFWLILLISQLGKQITAGSLKAWVESQKRRKRYLVCKSLFSLGNICSSIRLSFEAARSFYYSGLIASGTIISDFSGELLIAHIFLLK